LKGGKFLRLFFATDIHGSTTAFRKFLNAGELYNAEILVLGGDVTGKLVVPLFGSSNGTRETVFTGEKRIIKESDLSDFLRTVENSGFYSYATTKEDWSNITKSPKYDEIYNELAKERINSWISISESKLKDKGKVVFLTGGNDDPPWFKGLFDQNEWIKNVDEEVVDLHGLYQMVSLGYSNRTPWKTPREMDEDELALKIETLLSKCAFPIQKCVFNFHVPPYDSGLDTCPMVDGSTDPPKYVFKGGQPVMIRAGSKAVREAIEKHQPMLGLHGHIHETRAAIKIGKTLCLNPGSEYGEGILRGVLVNLDQNGNGVMSHQFISG
jgi:Icc-related predicted phosphoesterase